MIDKERRDKLIKRDGNKCRKCGKKGRKHLTIDHIIPKAHGGSDAADNLQTLCKHCNRAKADTPQVGKIIPGKRETAQLRQKKKSNPTIPDTEQNEKDRA